MTKATVKGIRILCCYAQKDEGLQHELFMHLSVLLRQGLITDWHNYQIESTVEAKETLSIQLDNADVILLLISTNFLASDFCNGIEMERILAKHKTEGTNILPIILNRVEWKCVPFGNLDLLPLEGKAVTDWSDINEAFYTVAKVLHALIKTIINERLYVEAEYWHEQALETSYQELGVDHPRTIEELHSLVQLYESHKKFAEGARIYKRDVEICKRMPELGLEHPRTIESQNNLASYYLRHKNHEEAKPLVKEMLHLCEPTLEKGYLSFEGKHLSREYIQAAVHSLTNAALLYQETYKDKQVLERAEKLLQKALKVSEELLDKEHQE